MRKGAFFLAVLVAASAPSLALAKRVHHVAKPAPAAADPNEPGARLVRDAVHQMFVPIESLMAPAPQPVVAHRRYHRRVHAHAM